MFIKAIYEPTKEKCYINTDYIIEVYPKVGRYLAYTFDNEREGYFIEQTDFDRYMSEQNKDIEALKAEIKNLDGIGREISVWKSDVLDIINNYL